MDPKQLLECAQDTSVDGRHRLAKAVSSFFSEQVLSDTEKGLASEILMNLIRQAELDLREALAERLAVEPNVPPDLIVFLANDQISVAKSVLMHSPVLNDVDLICIITSQGRDHWRVIAQREDLSPMVTDRLIDTKDTGTILNLVDNQRVSLQKGSLKKLIKSAMRSQELQAPLLRRPEVTAEFALDLYMVVSEEIRREIGERFSVPADVIDHSLESLVQELSNEARSQSDTTSDMLALAKRFHDRNDITADLLIKTLRRGQIGFFVALFSQRVGFAHHHVVKLIQKDSGKPFVVACRSLSMMKSEFASIFLLSRGIRTGDKIVDQRELAIALKNFDSLSDDDVQNIMSTWRKSPELI